MGAVEAAERETRAALALASTPGIGPATVRGLIDALGSATAVLAAASSPGRAAAEGREGRRFQAALHRLRRVRPLAADRLHCLRDRGIRVLTYGTPDYPASLTHLHHPPPVLYLRGRADPTRPGAVAIVGTRRSTPYGRRLAAEIARGLAHEGHTVVSGLARGIDAAAHRACLGARGVTIGVLGSGLDHCYPASSRDLYRDLPARGLLVSEFPPELGPRAGFFPRRNRIIAGLASAVVVVQAGRKSGALITVAHALELGRDVFAVPGPVGVPASEGVHGLLRDGAALATGPDDILDVVAGASRSQARREPDKDEPRAPGERGQILQLIEDGVTHVDALAIATGLATSRTLAVLSMLELEGRVQALPGGRYVSPGLREHR